LAALEYYSHAVDPLPCAQFEDVFAAVKRGAAQQAFLPIENSLAGSIHKNYDLLLEHNLLIVGEYFLRVSHCLMANPGVQLADLKQVRSHPQALAQCARRLQIMGIKPLPAGDTAGSARWLSQVNDPDTGVLASRRAAEVYGLSILKYRMEDNPENFTRFLIVADESPPEDRAQDQGERKTSLVFRLAHQPGSLFQVLKRFAAFQINLTKIESRPIQGKPWEYLFYIDFVEPTESRAGDQVLASLAGELPFLRVLGSYPGHHLPTQQQNTDRPASGKMA
jgi:prephenate dehydratase